MTIAPTIDDDTERAADGNYRLPGAELATIYQTMLRIRAFETAAEALFERGLVKGTAHSYVGQEAIAAAVCAALRPDDWIGSYHRGHGHCIAKGADLGRMMAELMGRRDGYCGGLGGSMHVADLSLGILGANGIVGATMPLATGAALAAQLGKTGQIAVAFFGDGAANQGVFHEAVNLAAVWRLPVLFVCENNQYALSTASRRTTAGPSIAARAVGYGIPGIEVDGNDPEAVRLVVADAAARARDGDGPSLIEAHSFRWGPHSMRDNLLDVRAEAEVHAWKARDPLVSTRRKLVDRSVLDEGELAAMAAQIDAEVDAAIAFGQASPAPEPAAALAAVGAPHKAYRLPAPTAGDRALSFVEAIAEAQRQAMEEDDRVILMGEDIGVIGGIFQATAGLHAQFGTDRVRDTPISEAGFTGCAVGAALAGLRPVVEIQIFDFVTQSMDMIVNQAAKLRFMMGGGPDIPLVIRGPQGGGMRLAAQHSQCLESWFAHVPGLVVIGPSCAYDAKGLLLAAIADANPVIFLESKLLYLASPEPVPEHPYFIEIGKGEVKRAGSDVTIVATMAMVPRALAAAQQLAHAGISAEVIDPRTLRPLDEDLIVASVMKTNRLVIVHEGWVSHGFGAEVTAMVVEKAFDWLDAPIVRVGAVDVPMPFATDLERWVIPSQARIQAAVVDMFGREQRLG